MPVEEIITDELAERVETLLGESAGAGHQFARRARAAGVMLVNPDRRAAMIDETIYAGALFRLRRAETRIESLVAEVRRVAAERDAARAELDGISGEFDDVHR